MKLLMRKTLNGSTEEFSFEQLCGSFLVKNFGEEPIYVSFDQNLIENESIKIAGGYSQEVITNEKYIDCPAYQHDKIFVKGTGEVEVQPLWF